MPWGTKERLLTCAGCIAVGAATVFYRRKQTTAFKVSTTAATLSLSPVPHLLPLSLSAAYFVAWPVLGSGIILGVTPSDEDLMQVCTCAASSQSPPLLTQAAAEDGEERAGRQAHDGGHARAAEGELCSSPRSAARRLEGRRGAERQVAVVVQGRFQLLALVRTCISFFPAALLLSRQSGAASGL